MEDGLVTITELAALKGVGKAAVSERVSRLEREGVIATLKRGRVKLVSLADYDAAIGETTSLSRMQAAATRRQASEPVTEPDEPAIGGANYSREQARLASYKADLAEIELKRKRGEVRDTREIVEAMTRCAEAIVKAIDRIPSRADEIAAAVARDGEQGARSALKTIARELRETLAREMRLLEGEGDADADDEAMGEEVDSE